MPGVAHSTSEKQKPGPLDLALLFWEVVDVKKASGAGSSTREILFSSIAEYNKCCTSKVGTPSAYHHLLFQSNVNGSVEITSIYQPKFLPHSRSMHFRWSYPDIGDVRARLGEWMKAHAACCIHSFGALAPFWRPWKLPPTIVLGKIQAKCSNMCHLAIITVIIFIIIFLHVGCTMHAPMHLHYV